jgi:hypothetical protein
MIYRKNHGITGDYNVGEPLICKTRFENIDTVEDKTVKNIIQLNYEYIIVANDGENVRIQDIATKEEHNISMAAVRMFFDYGYCFTCHSVQGASFDKGQKITIYDWNTQMASAEWLWVAVTRARDLGDIYFYIGPNLNDHLDVTQRLKIKVAGYKKQDMNAGRKIDNKNYVDVETLMCYLNTTCTNCNELLDINNMTADRVCCDIGHVKDNIQPMCRYCNCSKSNK